jgi:hypothetical protein
VSIFTHTCVARALVLVYYNTHKVGNRQTTFPKNALAHLPWHDFTEATFTVTSLFFKLSTSSRSEGVLGGEANGGPVPAWSRPVGHPRTAPRRPWWEGWRWTAILRRRRPHCQTPLPHQWRPRLEGPSQAALPHRRRSRLDGPPGTCSLWCCTTRSDGLRITVAGRRGSSMDSQAFDGWI